MSAYLHRLIQRFSPPTGEGEETQAVPFVRSRSPIAANDQLGSFESFGSFGFDESPDRETSGSIVTPTGPQVAAPATALAISPVAAHVRRKAAPAAPVMPPTSSATPPLAAAAPLTPPTSSHRVVSEAAPAPQPVHVTPSGETSDPIEPARRREPMDPGELFAPFPRFFDAEAPTIVAAPTPPLSDSSPQSPHPAVRLEPRVITFPPLVAPRAEAARAPWTPYEARAPIQPGVAPIDAPSLEPRPASPLRPQPQPQPLLVAPRVAAPQPFIPDPGEPARVPTGSTPRVSIGRVEIEIMPAPASAPAQPNTPKRGANGKLDIESISQIGPLARHFPNRRRLRLRYR